MPPGGLVFWYAASVPIRKPRTGPKRPDCRRRVGVGRPPCLLLDRDLIVLGRRRPCPVRTIFKSLRVQPIPSTPFDMGAIVYGWVGSFFSECCHRVVIVSSNGEYLPVSAHSPSTICQTA